MKKMIAFLLALVLPFACAAAEDSSAGIGENSLPPYVYTGEDPILAAVLEYTVKLHEVGDQEQVNVTIPEPVVIRVDQTDDTHARVYGDFWGDNYTLKENTLFSVSGGEAPGILELEKKDGKWQVVNFIQAEDGDDFYSSIEAMCGGDKELCDQMIAATDGSGEARTSARMQYVCEYVRENNLPVTAYQDYGWDPVPLTLGTEKN